MTRLGGKTQRGIRRALIVHGGSATTRQIWQWTHPREVNCRDRVGVRKTTSAQIKAARRVGRPRKHADNAAKQKQYREAKKLRDKLRVFEGEKCHAADERAGDHGNRQPPRK